MSVIFCNLGVFVPVVQAGNCGIYWVFLKVCSNIIRQISPELLCNILITPYTFALSHLPHSAAVHGHETNSSCTKLHVTAICYRGSTTD